MIYINRLLTSVILILIRFTANDSEYIHKDLTIFSERRLAFALFKSIIFSKSIREFLPGNFEASIKADKNIDFALSGLDALYARNFKLYKGLSSFTDAKVLYFLQPFSFWTNKELTLEEKSREYLESLQTESEWPSSREYCPILILKKTFLKFCIVISQNNISL